MKRFVRIVATVWLGCVPVWADVGSLIDGLSSEDDAVRVEASEDAGTYGYEAIVPVARLLDHEDYYVVQAARRALERICGAEPADAQAAQERSLNLCDALGQVKSNDGRRWVAWLLSYCGEHASSQLLDMLDNPELFDYALFALQGTMDRQTASEPPRRSPFSLFKTTKIESHITMGLMGRAQKATGDRRTALLNAVGATGGYGVVPALIDEAKKPVPECDPAIEALGRIGAEEAADVVWEQYGNGSEVALDAYLKIAERAKPKVAERMYRRVLNEGDEPHVQCAALRALGDAGGRDIVDLLVPYLAADRDDVRGSAARALEALDGRWVTRRVRNRLDKVEPSSRSALLRVIAARDGKGARDVLEKALKDPSPEVRVAAFTLLGGEPDSKYEQTFLDAARSGTGEARPAALGAYLSLADSVLRAGDEVKAQTMYETAMDLASENRERLLAVEGLAQIGRVESLPVLVTAAATPGLETPAGLAALSIAESIAATDPKKAQDTYFALLDRTPPRELARRIGQQLDAMGITVDTYARSGVITNWEVIGPFPATSFDTVYAPEIEYRPAGMYDGAADQRVAWKPHHTDDIQGIIDLPMLMKPTEDVIAYARAEIRVEQAQDVVLRLGSDDGVKAWLNDILIHSNNASRRVTVDDDIVPIRLKAGTNVLLLKIVQGGADWAYVVRLTDAYGKPVDFEN